MSRVPFRVHGPYQHRSRWRLDVYDHGRRYKRSFATYAEAIRAANDLTSGNSAGNSAPGEVAGDA